MNKDSSDKIIRNVLALSGSFVAFVSLYLAYSLYFGFALTTVKFYSFRLYLFIFIFEYLFSTAFTGVNRSFIFRGIFKESVAVLQLTCFLISLLILILFLLHSLGDSKRLVIGYFGVIFLVLEFSSRLLIKFVLVRLYKNSKFSNKILVITDNDCRKTIKGLLTNFDWRREICGISVPQTFKQNKKIYFQKIRNFTFSYAV